MADPVERCCDLSLATYTIHVRSFHPESNFGVAGIGYVGDDRGYSNVPRAREQRGKGAPPTSRVEHWIEFDLNAVKIVDKGATSDPSEWYFHGGKQHYDKTNDKTSDVRLPTVEATLRNDTAANDRCRRQVAIQSHHLGYNEAVPYGMHWAVPGLDVFGDFVIQVDCKARTMTITTRIAGDAFPNAEAFIVDAQGTSVFLGVHQRVGTPPAKLLGENHRFMFSSSLTLDLTGDGNFAGTLVPHGTLAPARQTVSQWNKKFLDQPATPLMRKVVDMLPPYIPDIPDSIGDGVNNIFDLLFPPPAH